MDEFAERLNSSGLDYTYWPVLGIEEPFTDPYTLEAAPQVPDADILDLVIHVSKVVDIAQALLVWICFSLLLNFVEGKGLLNGKPLLT